MKLSTLYQSLIFYLLGLVPLYAIGTIKSTLPLRDPTQPPNFLNEQVGNIGTLSLNAIIISPTRRIAVINNTMHRVGEDVFGNKITSIDANSVQLEGVSGKMTLFLSGHPVKQVVKSDK